MIVMARPIMIRANNARSWSMRSSRLLLEVLRVSTRRRAALTSVLRTESRRPVGAIGRGGHLEEADLSYLHAGIERDRQVRDVGELEGDVPIPAGVNETGRRVNHEAQSTERTLAVEAPDDVVG